MMASRPCSPVHGSPLVSRTLDLHLMRKQSRYSIKWGSINIVLLAVLLFDISNKCPYSFSRWYYVEYAASAILAASAVYHFGCYFYYLCCSQPLRGTEQQRRLLKFDADDNSFIVTTPTTRTRHPGSTEGSPANASSVSLHSADDLNITVASPGWVFNRSSPNSASSPVQQADRNASLDTSAGSTSYSTPFRSHSSRKDIIVDRKGLQDFLKEVSIEEQTTIDRMNNSINTMHAIWQSLRGGSVDLTTQLQKTIYQLSPTAPSTKQIKEHETSPYSTIVNGESEMLKKVTSVQLSNYVAYLRMWISLTILQRIETEMNIVDQAFKNRGFTDIQLGNIGLERLKKTAENQQLVSLYIPRLPLLIPFLEMSTNQEYLVQRIRDLSKGSCIADYRWNSGSSYKGLNWDEHLPTDSAIIFHLFCTYMDSQLRPLPQPGGRSFYHRYVIVGDKKTPKETLTDVKTRNKAKCAILCSNPLKPKFNFISDDKIHNSAYDRNNLFYVIIQFLMYMKMHHESSLEGINLGKSGINILCCIEDWALN